LARRRASRHTWGVNGLGSLGRMLLLAGLLVAAVGALVLVADRFPGLRIGRLPGDIRLERGNFRLYVPLATSVVVSVVLTALFWLLGRR
jgi:hypothetical protein